MSYPEFFIARKAGIVFSFEFGELAESRHPNAVKFILTEPTGLTASLVADSTGAA